MDKSQLEIRPGFLLGLIVIFIFSWAFSALAPAYSGKTKAKIINTRREEEKISSALLQRSIEPGAPTNIHLSFIYNALLGTNIYHPYYTNNQGVYLDLWDTPYQLSVVRKTNFVIRSAGKDKFFGDQDDIIFNSDSNDFVRP